MSIKKRSEIQSVTIFGATLFTLTGFVEKGSKIESALIAIKTEYEKYEVIQKAQVAVSALIHDLATPEHTPNIDYLLSCMKKENKDQVINWLLSIAKTIDESERFSNDDIYHMSAHLLMIIKEIIDGHC